MENNVYKKPESCYRVQALMAAKDFDYGEDVINAIKEAKNDDQILFIMQKARRKKFG